jgi:hypothetical protein
MKRLNPARRRERRYHWERQIGYSDWGRSIKFKAAQAALPPADRCPADLAERRAIRTALARAGKLF